MKRTFIALTLVLTTLGAFAATTDLATLIAAPAKSSGKKVTVAGTVFSSCPQAASRIFLSPDGDRTKRIPVMLPKGQTTDFRGKAVEVTGIVKKTAYVAPKPCGRCDGADCGKNVAEGSAASYYIEATAVKVQ